MGGGGGGRREVEGEERVEDEKMTQVDGRQGLSPLVSPVPVVVSAAVVAAFAAAVVLVLVMTVGERFGVRRKCCACQHFNAHTYTQ